MNRLTAALVLAAAGGLAGTAAAAPIQINGAGATFPYPIYSKWFSEYNKLHPDIQINYQSIGSGGGIRQLTNQTVFFAPPTAGTAPARGRGRSRSPAHGPGRSG